MLTQADKIEVEAIVQDTMKLLVQYLPDATTTAAADLRSLAGELHSNAVYALETASVGTQANEAFGAAFKAGMTAKRFDVIRRTVAAKVAETALGRACVVLFVRLSLTGIVRATAAETMESRQEADERLSALARPFRAAIDLAADSGESGAYRALSTLHATFTRDLAERSRRLPALVRYEFELTQPAAVLANRLYGDGGRAKELRDQNRALHPFFMPRRGDAFSS